MKYLKLITSVLVASLALLACKTEYELLLEGNDYDAKYAAAFDYFNRGKFQRAAQLFESLSTSTSHSNREDTVLFYWGMSNYNQKDYYTAETNFEHMAQMYPMSSFAEQAEYLRIDCMFRGTLRYELDQKPTYAAITAISEYIIAHPTSPNVRVCNLMLEELQERLDRKAFENAKIYYTMEDYKAARVALRNVLKDNADNLYREDVLYYTAMSSYKYAQLSVQAKQKERFMVFIDDYYNFIGEYPDSHYRRELDALYKKVKEK